MDGDFVFLIKRTLKSVEQSLKSQSEDDHLSFFLSNETSPQGSVMGCVSSEASRHLTPDSYPMGK